QPLAVFAALHLGDPVAMLHVPAHGPLEPGIERLARRPAEIAPDPRRIDRVAPVVAGPVRHVCDERAVAAVARPRLLECIAEGMDHVDVAALGVAADVVGLAGLAALEHDAERLAMVADVEPVAHLPPVA